MQGKGLARRTIWREEDSGGISPKVGGSKNHGDQHLLPPYQLYPSLSLGISSRNPFPLKKYVTIELRENITELYITPIKVSYRIEHSINTVTGIFVGVRRAYLYMY